MKVFSTYLKGNQSLRRVVRCGAKQDNDDQISTPWFAHLVGRGGREVIIERRVNVTHSPSISMTFDLASSGSPRCPPVEEAPPTEDASSAMAGTCRLLPAVPMPSMVMALRERQENVKFAE